jgi:hypothetical protein
MVRTPHKQEVSLSDGMGDLSSGWMVTIMRLVITSVNGLMLILDDGLL